MSCPPHAPYTMPQFPCPLPLTENHNCHPTPYLVSHITPQTPNLKPHNIPYHVPHISYLNIPWHTHAHLKSKYLTTVHFLFLSLKKSHACPMSLREPSESIRESHSQARIDQKCNYYLKGKVSPVQLPPTQCSAFYQSMPYMILMIQTKFANLVSPFLVLSGPHNLWISKHLILALFDHTLTMLVPTRKLAPLRNICQTSYPNHRIHPHTPHIPCPCVAYAIAGPTPNIKTTKRKRKPAHRKCHATDTILHISDSIPPQRMHKPRHVHRTS